MVRFFVLLTTCLTWAVSNSAFALKLETNSGIEVLFVNGKPVPESGQVHFSENTLQLVARYSGRLKKNGGKLESLSTYPYVISLESALASDDGVIELSLVSNRYHQVNDLNANKKPVFHVSAPFPVQETQQVLPAKSKVFPYMNIGPLVKAYNQQHKTVFADQPLGHIQSTGQSTDATPSATTVQQLKFWFTKASEKERREFLRWTASQ